MSRRSPTLRPRMTPVLHGGLIACFCPLLLWACNSDRDTQKSQSSTEVRLENMADRVRRIESKLARANQERAKLMAQVQSLESKVIHQGDSKPIGQAELVVHHTPKTLDLTDLRRQQRVSPRYWRRIKAFRDDTRMTGAQLETLVELVGQEKDKVFALPRNGMSRQSRIAAARDIRKATDMAIAQKLGERIGLAWAKFRKKHWFKVWKATSK